MYRMFVLIDTRSACTPFHSPLPQKGSSVAISQPPFFFLLIFAVEVSNKKWILRAWRSFHLAVSGRIVKADSVYRSWGSQHSETSICWCHHPLGNNKGQSVCVNQLVARIWTPAPQGEDPIIVFACCTALPRELQSLRHHAQIWQCLLSVYLAISLSSTCDLAASAVRLINRSHQQEVLRPIRPGKLVSGLVSILVLSALRNNG